MFLHVGGDVAIPVGDVVAIVNAQTPKRAPTTRAFLEQAKSLGHIKHVGEGTVNAYVVTDLYVYASPISSTTLKKRAESGRIARSSLTPARNCT